MLLLLEVEDGAVLRTTTSLHQHELVRFEPESGRAQLSAP